jgi:hypothetical protein
MNADRDQSLPSAKDICTDFIPHWLCDEDLKEPFVNRTKELAQLARALFLNQSVRYDPGKVLTLFSALSWGSGKTFLGLCCLRQFRMQFNSIVSILRKHFGYSPSGARDALTQAEDVCLAYVQLTAEYSCYAGRQ